MRKKGWATGSAIFFFCVLGAANDGHAGDAYRAMAPLAQYQMASPFAEVALARSAAPASISGDAEVMTFGDHGYRTEVKGKNEFVCLVWRSWGAGVDDAEFWNPKIRAPICLNAAAARSVLPNYLERTKWVLAGSSKSDVISRIKAAMAANRFLMPEPGAMCYMMSKQGYLADANGHWHPHLMFFLAHIDAAAWGANLDDSPVFAGQSEPDPVTTFLIPVTQWSDGTPADAQMR